MILTVDTGQAVQVAPRFLTLPAWSPDGSQLTFDVRLRTGTEIWLLPATALKDLPRIQLTERNSVADDAQSPDRANSQPKTVSDADAEPAQGTGLTFPPKAAGLGDALKRSLALFADQPRYAAVQRRGMERDFSWATAAKGYVKLYAESL